MLGVGQERLGRRPEETRFLQGRTCHLGSLPAFKRALKGFGVNSSHSVRPRAMS